jgi:hypothetical protein
VCVIAVADSHVLRTLLPLKNMLFYQLSQKTFCQR